MAIISPNTVDLIHAVVRGHLDQDVRTSTIKALSGIEYNVLQVAIDHMIEHQEGLQSDDVPWRNHVTECERLEAAKKLKALFS